MAIVLLFRKSEPLMILTPNLEEMWLEVKEFYENSYRDHRKQPIRFKGRPSEENIRMLYEKMKQMQTSLRRFYHSEPHLADRLYRFRGQLPPQA